MILGLLTIDMSVNLGNLLVAGLLAGIGWGLRQMWKATRDTLNTIASTDYRLKKTVEVVDHHSYALLSVPQTEHEQFHRLGKTPLGELPDTIRKRGH